MADNVNTEIGSRLDALKNVATIITPAILGDTASIQKFLEDRLTLASMFSIGVYVTRVDGTVVADSMVSSGRIGVNYLDRDYISAHVLIYGSCIIQISVTDTGVGIAAEALEKIFNPFVQEDGSTTRQFGGTGLGLTICRRLAELMGGYISVESSQGVGSSFIVSIPFTIPTIQHTTEMLPLMTSPVWDGPSLRILLVEDNPVNLKFATVLLGKHGRHVVTAENGRESLEALEKGEFDLVLMDIQMPVMNGEEALRAIRAKEAGTTAHLKVIALTAHALRDEKERFLSEGFDGYLSKPMERGELIAEMKRVMHL